MVEMNCFKEQDLHNVLNDGHGVLASTWILRRNESLQNRHVERPNVETGDSWISNKHGSLLY